MFVYSEYLCFTVFEMETKIISMNKSVIPKDYLVDKSDNALLAKNKKKKGGGEIGKKYV